jgi:hypothetical protein
MLTKLNYTVSVDLLQEAANSLPSEDFKSAINSPTGSFFYDPWVIKPEFKDTVWSKILSTLPFEVGEARIIVLSYGNCYQSHGDIDDRYHLNISGQYSYLMNLETETMYPLSADGVWYEMSAGSRHSAANFGYIKRIQFVVRKLLTRNTLTQPISIKVLYVGTDKDKVRFTFDDVISPWLNKANKKGVITDFNFAHNDVKFKIDEDNLKELENILPKDFEIEIL